MVPLILATGLMLGAPGCGATCPLPVEHETSLQVEQIVADGVVFTAHVEAISERTGKVVHRASGPLVWHQKTHILGKELRDVPWDKPDYEVNSVLISPTKVWTST